MSPFAAETWAEVLRVLRPEASSAFGSGTRA